MRDIIHVDEVPCQVLHEEGMEATSKSYMWIYLSGTDGKPAIVYMIISLAAMATIQLNFYPDIQG